MRARLDYRILSCSINVRLLLLSDVSHAQEILIARNTRQQKHISKEYNYKIIDVFVRKSRIQLTLHHSLSSDQEKFLLGSENSLRVLCFSFHVDSMRFRISLRVAREIVR